MPPAPDSSEFYYLYGIVKAQHPLPAGSLSQVKGDGLIAVVEAVSAVDYAPEALEQRLASIGWVTERARKHHAVLEAMMLGGPVVPARLCTLFSSLDAVAETLAEQGGSLHDTLAALEGREEWGLKVWCSARALEGHLSALDPTLAAPATEVVNGMAYLQARKRDARRAAAVTARIEEAVDEVLDAVEPIVVECRARPLLSEAVTGHVGAMALNAALLVDEGALDALAAAVDAELARLAPEGFSMELSGPWPAYSFCDPADDAPDDDAATDAAP